jgi:tetratricopeptide (TPR) repeat protein
MRGTTEAEHGEAITCKIQGNINYRRGDYEQAILFYDKGLKFDPDNADIWNNKGLALFKLGRIDEARQCKMQLKRLEEQSAASQSISPANTAETTEKPSHCTVKIKGITQDTSIQAQEPVQAAPDPVEKARNVELQFRDIEQNIESIESGLNQVRLGRIEEAKQCKLQIKAMEERIELTRQGLNAVKRDKIEEAKKIRIIEEHMDMTKKGLELIKLGRMEEAKQYRVQLKSIEENIELTRKSLKQVKPAVAGRESGPALSISTGKSAGRSDAVTPVQHIAAGQGTGSTQQIKDIEDIIALPHEEVDQQVTPGKIRLAGILFIFFVVIILAYFAFFK